MATYDVFTRLEGEWWMIVIPAIDTTTQSDSYEGIELAARECIAVTEGVPLDSVQVDIRPDEGGLDASLDPV